MDEKEKRLLAEHTEALVQHSEALNRMTLMLGELMSNGNGGVRSASSILAEAEDAITRATSIAQSVSSEISKAGRMMTESANAIEQASRVLQSETEKLTGNNMGMILSMLDECSRRVKSAGDAMCYAAERMPRHY